jgi:hypothetical protein
MTSLMFILLLMRLNACVSVCLQHCTHSVCVRVEGAGRLGSIRAFPTQGTKWRLYSFEGGGDLLMNSEQQSIHFKSLSHRAAVSDIQITLQFFYDS